MDRRNFLLRGIRRLRCGVLSHSDTVCDSRIDCRAVFPRQKTETCVFGLFAFVNHNNDWQRNGFAFLFQNGKTCRKRQKGVGRRRILLYDFQARGYWKFLGLSKRFADRGNYRRFRETVCRKDCSVQIDIYLRIIFIKTIKIGCCKWMNHRATALFVDF